MENCIFHRDERWKCRAASDSDLILIKRRQTSALLITTSFAGLFSCVCVRKNRVGYFRAPVLWNRFRNLTRYEKLLSWFLFRYLLHARNPIMKREKVLLLFLPLVEPPAAHFLIVTEPSRKLLLIMSGCRKFSSVISPPTPIFNALSSKRTSPINRGPSKGN